MGENDDEKYSQAGQIFENFVQASTCKGTIQAFNILTRQLELDPLDNRNFYTKLKSRVTTWKAKALWNKLDKRASHKEYKRGKSCMNTKCLIIGGGPCGLRTAIELALLGAKVVVVEKRDTFSRNNVLHLWPFTIHDLRGLGAKKFYGKFCAGSIDHISIRQLQLILFKVALMLGIEIHVNLEFVKVVEPPEDQENQKIGWRAEFLPVDHPLSEFEFDVIIGADGRRNTLEGFRRKEFRGKLAIAITANFINRNTTAEAKVEEISGVAFIFNQKFFQDLKEETGIDLENIVYYKDSTHYFVMTAKKQSLLDKGVIINDCVDTELLLCGENVNQSNLLSYAREAADFATNYQLPSLDFAINHYGQPDVAMFDFTSMYASENAALVRERHRHQLLVALVGDSLLEVVFLSEN
nr:F-actin-monooxygenase MICAL2 isoform X3 [Dromaius novaehollandiae]